MTQANSTRPFLASAVLLLAAVLASAQTSDLGRIDFATSGQPAALEHFLRGVLFLHSFEYADARQEFQAAEKLDPGFALAFWGEAMTYNHPIWQEQDLEAARAVLNRLAPTPEARLAKAPTEREKAYLRALEILYGEGDKLARDRAYAAAMRRLAEQYPGDLEAASFSALALLGSVRERDYATYMQAAAIAEQVFVKNPEHPGAVHYLIHSYDDPIHAPLGLRVARVYAKIAPAATHAQHMPSHIFLALGMWDDVAAANEASWAASLQHGDPSYHALHWLEYAYLQEGRYREARQLLERMEADSQKSTSPQASWHLAAMHAAYLVETRQWSSELAATQVGPEGVSEISAPAGSLFAQGLAAVKRGDLAAANRALAELKALRASAATESTQHHSSMSMYSQVSSGALKAAEVMEQELAALLLAAEGKREDAVAALEAAAAAEDSMSFDFGPPAIVKPSRELLGERLLEMNRPEEAEKQFELALTRAPRRALALLGLARSASRAGHAEAAERAYADLRSLWQRADAGLADLQEIRAGGASTNR
ncbi:MAG: hypothetical protein ACRD35_04370 [Candidatus Acidiferrales bacterium]